MSISNRRNVCVWLGFVVVCLLALWPPWVQIDPTRGLLPAQRWNLGHAPLFDGPHAHETSPGWRLSYDKVDYPGMFTEIAVGECFVLALYLTWGRISSRPRACVSHVPESKEQIQEDVDGLIAALRQNLRIKVGWDESKIDRQIEYERERLGNLPLQTLMGAAIERWERDNR